MTQKEINELRQRTGAPIGVIKRDTPPETPRKSRREITVRILNYFGLKNEIGIITNAERERFDSLLKYACY